MTCHIVFPAVRGGAAQDACALSLCKEVLQLLNNCRSDGRATAKLLGVVVTWVGESDTSPLLYSLLSAACLNLASLPNMLSISEACMDAHFAGATSG